MKAMSFGDLEQLATRLRTPVKAISMPADIYSAVVEYRTNLGSETWLIDLTGRLERRVEKDGQVKTTEFTADPLHVSCLFVDYVLDAVGAEEHE